ncbi:MAG TPA: hypothetical protein VIA06_25330 [Candidatus Dormibacteraeota bacterium]|jgi:hypothetical protein|nr:hypothetical protein [Candidatus Dormibacteraeota bacterium]
MMAQAAKALIRVGAILLVMSLLARLAGLSTANLIGDDLAIAASLGVILTGVLYLRFSRR